jgi:hypothetical protein
MVSAGGWEGTEEPMYEEGQHPSWALVDLTE